MAFTSAYSDVEKHTCPCQCVCMTEAAQAMRGIPLTRPGRTDLNPHCLKKKWTLRQSQSTYFSVSISRIMKTPFRTDTLMPASSLSKIKLFPNICNKTVQVNTCLSSPGYRPWAGSLLRPLATVLINFPSLSHSTFILSWVLALLGKLSEENNNIQTSYQRDLLKIWNFTRQWAQILRIH